MARSKLILLPIALLLMSAKGCLTLDERTRSAAEARGQAQASTPWPGVPQACVAKMGRIRPKAGEPRVITMKRVDVVIDNRNRQADDCAAWNAEMKNSHSLTVANSRTIFNSSKGNHHAD